MFQSANAFSIMSIQEVWDQYRPDLLKVEAQIQKNLSSEVALINQASQYILNSGGKRIRPLLMVLASRVCPNPGDRHITLAAVVEFIHTATLLHDDVIDEGDLRRGKKTVRNLWGNHASILVGDYLYTNAIGQGLSLHDHEINLLVQKACGQMIEGEMAQHVHHRNPEMEESDYLRIIQNKTASLLALSCHLGGIVSGASPDQIESLRRFGLYLGMAFQVADDTLDYTAQEDRLGKILGTDLKEGKLTLPLIHLLKHCTPGERKRIIQAVGTDPSSDKPFGEVLKLMNRHGSIDYAFSVARKYVEKAKNLLAPFEASVHKRALCVVADYVVSRDH